MLPESVLADAQVGSNPMKEAHRQETILVVDDHEDVRRGHRMLFETRGFTVQEAADGAQALASIAKSVPSLVILDLMMPGMDGLDVLKAIRQNPATRNLPVIIVTAKTAPEDIQLGYRSEADYYVTKPCSNAQLRQVVDTILALQKIDG
jgi:CheY-like chemotaxis protein